MVKIKEYIKMAIDEIFDTSSTEKEMRKKIHGGIDPETFVFAFFVGSFILSVLIGFYFKSISFFVFSLFSQIILNMFMFYYKIFSKIFFFFILFASYSGVSLTLRIVQNLDFRISIIFLFLFFVSLYLRQFIIVSKILTKHKKDFNI